MIRIRNWEKHFENNRSKTVTNARWVPIPNRHDSEGYALMMSEKDSAEIFAAWILILQVASRCQPRGSLLRDDGTPITLDILAIRTRAPLKWFEKAIPFLCKVSWIELLAGDCQSTASQPTSDCQEGALNGRNGMERKECVGFDQFWAAYPRKEAKVASEKAFAKVDVDVSVLLDALAWQTQKPGWKKDNGQFIPIPTTWLNQRRWEDEKEILKTSGVDGCKLVDPMGDPE